VNAFRANFVLRMATVAMAFFAWLVLSNHCALSEMVARHAADSADEGDCCHHSPGSKHDGSSCPQMPQGCCKTLKVAMPEGAKLLPAVVAELVPVVMEMLHALAFAPPSESAAAPDPGPPPDVPAFAELVLNRSLLSHAPPVLA
jgi:hypothetical protein